MRIVSVLFPLALFISPIIAAAAAVKDLSTFIRGTVTCTAKDVTNERPRKVSWKVSVATAKAEMVKAGISHQGKTGYPHSYHNRQNLDWSVATCKKTNIDQIEYLVFRDRHAPIDNTKKTDKQTHSPIRVLYANDGGAMVYCGVLTHEEAKRLEDVGRQESWSGEKGFKLCI